MTLKRKEITMKKLLCLILAAATLLCCVPASAAVYETYGSTSVPVLEKYTNAIYLGVLCEEKGTKLLYKIGSDDLDNFMTIMGQQGYKMEVKGDSIYFNKEYTLNQNAVLTYLSDNDEYALELPSIYAKSYGILASTQYVIDPASVYAYAKRINYNGVQNTYYFAMRADDIATYLRSMQNKGYRLLSETEREWVLRNGTEAISVKTLGEGRYSSIIMAITVLRVKEFETDSDVNDAVLNKSKFTTTYYEGNKGSFDGMLGMNSVYIIKVYASGDRSAYITADRLAEYKAVGWYETIEEMSRTGNNKMYSSDGRIIYVAADEVESYMAVGWDTLPPITMYSADGRELSVLPKDIDAYIAVGWYLSANEASPEKTVEMYSADGRTIMVAPSQVEAYRAVGWYSEPMVEMRPADLSDERVISVPEEEVEAYISVGWVRK
ncbi:MAG: hypothetical protein ACI4SS_01770 [Clostridia bacterium]